MSIPIDTQRLHNQRLTHDVPCRAADVVARLGAVQAQEYAAAKWALALRMGEETTDARIERDFADGRILRTHVMRPTWHFVAAEDIRWMLELTGPKVVRSILSMGRGYELDAATCAGATRVFARALARGGFLTRAELGAALGRAGIVASTLRLALMTMYAELEGVICSGPYRAKQLTYALLEARVPRARRLTRDEALAKLATRYFTSHGPATLRDFVWWSGMATADARRGLDMIKARSETHEGRTYWTLSDVPRGSRRTGAYLLPIYDEYVVAYRDRDAVPLTSPNRRLFPQPLVIAGQVAGTWSLARAAGAAAVDVKAQRLLTAAERRSIAQAAARYGRFLGLSKRLGARIDEP